MTGRRKAGLGVGVVVAIAAAVGGGAASSGGGSTNGVRVTRAVAQSILTSTSTEMSWTAETRDDAGISAVDAGANGKVCTFTDAGVWAGSAILRFAANTTGDRIATVARYNSSDVLQGVVGIVAVGSSKSFSTDLTVSFVTPAAAGDYIKVYAWQNSGGNLDVGGGYGECYLYEVN